MTATTANRGYPYPQGSDFLGDTAAHIQALAEAVDDDVEAIAPDTTAWTAATLQNGWTHSAASGVSPRYRKIAGVVYVQGFLTGGTAATGTTILTLPAGFRPADLVQCAQPSNGAYCDVTVDETGAVKTGNGVSSAWLCLSLSFPADV